jgi:hypothetical protein
MAVSCGIGFTRIENNCGVPEQLLDTGVTVMSALIGMLALLVDVKEAISPVPDDANPTAGLVLIQLYTVPGTLDPSNKIFPVGAPLQSVISAMGLRNGVGFTRMVN